MKKITFLFFCFFSISFCPQKTWAVGAGQIRITSPTYGASYSSTENVSTSVSWSYIDSTSSYYYLDRRLLPLGSYTYPNGYSCYFNPVLLTATSGTQSGTLRNGSGSASSTYSSANCFSGSETNFVLVASVAYCTGSSFSSLTTCIDGDASRIVAMATRYFTHD